MTEKNTETLSIDAKLLLLAKEAAGKKGVISADELMNYFKDDQLTPEQLAEFLRLVAGRNAGSGYRGTPAPEPPLGDDPEEETEEEGEDKEDEED